MNAVWKRATVLQSVLSMATPVRRIPSTTTPRASASLSGVARAVSRCATSWSIVRPLHPATSAGTGRPNSSMRYSARLRACAKIALNIRCSSRLSRRMSNMIATLGRIAAMYEKFWSGPTPMYAPPRTPSRLSVGTTWRYDVSLVTRLSESK